MKTLREKVYFIYTCYEALIKIQLPSLFLASKRFQILNFKLWLEVTKANMQTDHVTRSNLVKRKKCSFTNLYFS